MENVKTATVSEDWLMNAKDYLYYCDHCGHEFDVYVFDRVCPGCGREQDFNM